jgi:hypothetical protein
MEILREVYHDEIPIYRTNCCSLVQLSLQDYTSVNEIKSLIEREKEKSFTKMTQNDSCNYNGHERAIFVITLEKETTLVENLKTLGFKSIAQFHRRICYPQDELLTMWFLDW